LTLKVRLDIKNGLKSNTLLSRKNSNSLFLTISAMKKIEYFLAVLMMFLVVLSQSLAITKAQSCNLIIKVIDSCALVRPLSGAIVNC